MYKPSIRIGDVFQTKSSNDFYGKSKLTIVKIKEDTQYAQNEDSSWVYFKIDPKIHGKVDDNARLWWFRDHCVRIWSKEEKSLLMYLETCLVDQYGRVEQRRMNGDDFNIMERWNAEGLIETGRLNMKAVQELRGMGKVFTHWVRFSEEAWRLAHELRRTRSERILAQNSAKLIKEKVVR